MDDSLTRRDMILGTTLGLGLVCTCAAEGTAPAARSTNSITPRLEPESLAIGSTHLTIDLARAACLASEGTAAEIVDNDKSIGMIVVHAGKDEYYALSRLCTHAWRTLSYIRTRRVLMCCNANHSIFDLHGRIVKGPAPQPLTSYPVQLAGGKLLVQLQGVPSTSPEDAK